MEYRLVNETHYWIRSCSPRGASLVQVMDSLGFFVINCAKIYSLSTDQSVLEIQKLQQGTLDCGLAFVIEYALGLIHSMHHFNGRKYVNTCTHALKME